MKLEGIDFRIWHRGSQRFFFSNEVVIGKDNKDKEMHAWHNGEPLCPSDCELELKAGSIDKTAYYEGDIVYFEYRNQVFMGVIVFEKNCFYCEALSQYRPLNFIKIKSIEGNIHEDIGGLEVKIEDLLYDGVSDDIYYPLKQRIGFLKFLKRTRHK